MDQASPEHSQRPDEKPFLQASLFSGTFALEGDVQHTILWQNIIMDTLIDYFGLQDPWVRENLTYSFDKCVLWE